MEPFPAPNPDWILQRHRLRDATVEAPFHRVGRRLGFRFVAGSASSLSIRTGLAGTTTLHPFTLPRF